MKNKFWLENLKMIVISGIIGVIVLGLIYWKFFMVPEHPQGQYGQYPPPGYGAPPPPAAPAAPAEPASDAGGAGGAEDAGDAGGGKRTNFI